MKNRLKPLLITTISVMILLLLLLQGIVLSFSLSGLLSEKIYEMSAELLEQKNLRLEEKIGEIRNIALSVAINRDIISTLEDIDKDDYYQQIKLTKSISNYLSSISDSRDDISKIFIITDCIVVYNYANVNGLIEKELVKNLDFYSIITTELEGAISTGKKFIQNDSSDKYVATFFRKLLSSNNKELGILCVVLNEKGFQSIITDKGPTSSDRITYFLTKENDIISPDSGFTEELHLGLYNENEPYLPGLKNRQLLEYKGSEYLSIITSANAFGWRIIQLIPYSEINSAVPEILRNIIIIGLVCMGITLLFLFYFSKSITTPIENLIKQMHIVGSGTFSVSIKKERIIEIEELNSGFLQMTGQIQDLLTDIKLEHKRMRQAELTALQAQINPHFLYNTLDLINWMAIDRKANDISSVVSDLGLLFRLGLNGGKPLTSIRNEAEHVRCYMNIQSMLSERKIVFREEYNNDIMDLFTVKLILQPIVENSIIHGFKNRKKNGEITVSGKKVNEDIIFLISDSGSGVDSEYMNYYLENRSGQTEEGFGIRNVNDRIVMRFGSNYGLTYMPVETGTVVQVKIPQILKKDEENVL